MSEQIKRILILGSTNHDGTTAYDWSEVPDELSVADFDIVLIDFVTCSDNVFEASANKLANKWQQFARLLFSEESEVVIIGSPIRKKPIGANVSAARWLPQFPNCDVESGIAITNVDSEFDYYFNNVSSYSFYLEKTFTSDIESSDYAKAVNPNGNSVRADVKAIAATRFDRAIAVELGYAILDSGGSRINYSGKVFWLPSTTRISVHESLELILSSRYDIGGSPTAPSWIENYKLPNQIPIEQGIMKINNNIAELNKTLVLSQVSLAEESRFQKLLYEQDFGLEPLVREALTLLGASVEEPARAGHEDGRFTDPFGRNGMLEVKSSTGSVRLRDVRQLDQWVRDAMAEEEWQGKGVLIANTFRDVDLDERGEPFPDNCVRAAERFGCSLITTASLFHALCEYQQGVLNPKTFWDAIFDSSGICPLPEVAQNQADSNRN